MRAIIVALAMIAGSASAQEVADEHRVIANAVWLLKLTGGASNTGLRVISRDRAALLEKGHDPELIQRTDACTYEVRNKLGGGRRINFARLTDQFSLSCSVATCQITVRGARNSTCLLRPGGGEECQSDLRLWGFAESTASTIGASLRLIFDSGCGPYVEQVKPRF